MRLLAVTIVAGLHLVSVSGIYAPFMEKSAAVTNPVLPENLRSCRENELVLNKTKSTPLNYPIPCNVANSFFVTGDFQPTDKRGEPEISGCYYCDTPGTNSDICDPSKLQTAVMTGTSVAGRTMFTETASCSIEAGKIKKPQLKQRFARIDRLKDAEEVNNFHVKTVPNFIQPINDVVASYSESFYADTFNWQEAPVVKCRGCLGGAYLQFQGAVNRFFDIELFPAKKCEWIIFCFDHKRASAPFKCERKAEVYLFLHNGIVHSGNRQSAFAMNLEYGRSIRMKRTNGTASRFWITSGQNERLVLEQFNTGEFIVMAMSHHDCLEAPIQGTRTFGSSSFVNPKPTDPNRVNPREPMKIITEDDGKKDAADHNEVALSDLGAAQKVDALSEPSTTTEKVLNITAAPTTEVPTQPPSFMGLVAPKYDNEAGKAQYKGWLTWAYFYGSLTGTLIGFLICALLFFLIRRTVYRDWYRGMYKRYGCDASGTTGGVTGAEFGATTTGGNTTIGSTTAGATTGATMGETTGGTTSGDVTTGGTGTRSMITI